MPKKMMFYFLCFFVSFSVLNAEEPIKENVPPSIFEELKEDNYGMSQFMGEMIQMLTVLGVILAIMIIGSLLIKRVVNNRMHQMNSSSSIKILERRMLSAKAGIYLLDIKGQGLLIGESPNGLTMLGEVDISNDDEDMDSGPSFEDILNNPQKPK